MNELLNKLFYLPAAWRFCILMMISVVITFWLYQRSLAQQIIRIDHHKNQSVMLVDRLKNYLDNQSEIINKKTLFSQEQQKLTKFKQTLERFNQNAPEQNLLQAAKEAKLKPQEIQISAVQQDEWGRYYSVEITIKSDLPKISKFLNDLMTQTEFAVWQRLTIARQANDINLTLAIKYYFGLFDESVS